jgi:hypothetical protein
VVYILCVAFPIPRTVGPRGFIQYERFSLMRALRRRCVYDMYCYDARSLFPASIPIIDRIKCGILVDASYLGDVDAHAQ